MTGLTSHTIKQAAYQRLEAISNARGATRSRLIRKTWRQFDDMFSSYGLDARAPINEAIMAAQKDGIHSITDTRGFKYKGPRWTNL